MPTKYKCQFCGEDSFLTIKVLRNKENGRLYYLMICDKCKAKIDEVVKKNGVRTGKSN